ncbi:MAG: hypothetical protein GY795_44615 [Desulfobacterales bacterium]|nr:hypothetical protein [Desulfobacterales bacterium]
MPLKAKVGGKEMIAPFIEDNEWELLKNRIKNRKVFAILSCCNAEAFLRVSKLGTKHFVHKNESCDWKTESVEHLKAKEEIAFACKTLGYEVTTEHSENDWRADVFIWKGNVRIAFEIQTSSQTLEKTEDRQDRYRRDKVRCCWFFKKIPKGYNSPIYDLPLFELHLDSDKYSVSINSSSSFPLYEFVRQLLKGNIRFCNHLKLHSKQKVIICFFETECRKCKKISHFYKIENISPDTICGIKRKEWHKFSHEIKELVRNFLQTKEAGHLKVKTGSFHSNKITSTHQWSFKCCYCNVALGDNPAKNSKNEVASFEHVIILHVPLSEKYPHWCFSEQKIFCE